LFIFSPKLVDLRRGLFARIFRDVVVSWIIYVDIVHVCNLLFHEGI
jgi:hypothetical protein